MEFRIFVTSSVEITESISYYLIAAVELPTASFDPSTWLFGSRDSQCSDKLRAGRFGDEIPVGARFFLQSGPAPTPTQTPCTMDTGSFPLGLTL
jgi:hypothetical protein